MGTCLAQPSNSRKYKPKNTIFIKEEFNIAIAPTSTSLPQQYQPSNVQSNQTNSLSPLHLVSKKEIEQPEIDPLVDIEKPAVQKKPNIRPTISIFVPENSPEYIKQENKQPIFTPKTKAVHQSDFKKLFPDGMEPIQEESSCAPSRPEGRSSHELSAKASQVKKSRLSFGKIDMGHNFLQSNMHDLENKESSKKIPSLSILKNTQYEGTNNNIPSQKVQTSAIKNNIMLESQTIPLIQQRRLEKQKITMREPEHPKQAQKRNIIKLDEEVPNQEAQQPDSVKISALVFTR